MKAEELDRLFDAGEDITPHLDLSSPHRPNLEARRVEMELPAWLLERVEQAALKSGVNRQSIIKMWLAERAAQTLAAAH